MRKLLIFLFLAAASALSASYISLPSWEEASHLRRQECDLLYNGSEREMRGKLEALPPLNYSFGTLRFSPEELAAVAVLEEGRLQYVTESGATYVAPGDGSALIFTTEEGRRYPASSSPGCFIFLKKTGGAAADGGCSVFFEDGSRMAADLTSEAIAIGDGREERMLPPSRVAKLSKSEGIYLYSKGGTRRLQGVFVRDSSVTLSLPKQKLVLRLPWERIEKIESKEFEDKEALVSLLLQALPTGRREALEPGADLAEGRLRLYFRLPGRYMAGLTLPPPTVSEGLAAAMLTPRQVMQAIDRLDVMTLVDAISLEAWKGGPQPLFADSDDFGVPTGILFLDSYSRRFSLENLAALLPDSPDPFEELEPLRRAETLELADSAGEEALFSEELPGKELLAELEGQLKEEMLKEGMVHIEGGGGVPSFYIGVYQVTGGDYQEFLDATGYPPPPGGVGDDTEAMVDIAYQDALAYAHWKEMTLPTVEEWERAAKSELIETGAGTQYEWVLGEEGERILNKGEEPFKPGYSEQVTGFRLVAH